ncbi:MAG: glycosyltransferase family 2 protein [Desulfobulbaceae bacterium]|nr:glycosyltransferase family 2 protein [Desulfobulbaceae bacterium]
MKLISVVIPCYNHGQYLDEAVESVLAQTYKHVEIVIVNDGSTDLYTVDILNAYNKPNCKVLHTDNQGLPAARNNGIRLTKGEYICCLDADDKYHPEYFSKAVEIFKKDKDIKYGAVPAWAQLFGSSKSRDNILWKTIGHNSEGFEPFLQGVRNRIHSSTIFRRICWEKIGGYDESMTSGYEDWDFWVKMLSLDFEWFCLAEPLIYYRQKDHSMVTQAHEVRPDLLRTLIEKNYEFYVKNMIPIFQEMDREIFMVRKNNKKLFELLVAEKENQSSRTNKSVSTDLKGKFQHVFRKLFCNE